jgi:DUF917 family protein
MSAAITPLTYHFFSAIVLYYNNRSTNTQKVILQMKRTLSYDEIINIIWGATLMGGGGGGQAQDGLGMLQNYIDTHHLQKGDIAVDLINPADMGAADYAAVIAGMGAPSALGDKDFSPYVTNAFELLQSVASRMDTPRHICYSIGLELGGANTFVPLLIALVKNIPFIDADGSGRAVPALNMLLLHINGNDTSPLALANGNNDKVTIELSNPKDADTAENIGRGVCVAFDMISGLAGWMIQSAAITDTLPLSTITLCEKIGAVMLDQSITDKFATLAEKGILQCQKLFEGTIIKGKTKEVDGFDVGTVTFQETSTKRLYTIGFQNESLVITGGKRQNTIMTAPDIIGCYDQKTGLPLTNTDLFDDKGKIKTGTAVVVGLIKVDERWWLTGYDHINALWKPYFARVSYNGDVTPYKSLSKGVSR